MKQTRVLAVASDNFIRLGLRTVLSARSASVIGEAAGALDAVAKTSALQPDIVLMDVGSVPGDSLETIREIARAALGARIVVLSDSDDETFVEGALMCGASAYLLKQTATADLDWAIQAVQKGREYFSPVLIQRLRHPEAIMPEPDQRLGLQDPPLSAIEARLITMINQGVIIRQLAQELCANLEAIRKYHPQLLAKIRPKRLASIIGLDAAKRLLSGLPKATAQRTVAVGAA